MKVKNCDNCNSEDLLQIHNNSNVYRKYRKEVRQAGAIYTEESGLDFRISKFVCLGCGKVFEYMDDEFLKKYHEYKDYFIN